MTTIEDVLTYADGSKANGRLAVFWRPFTISNANVTGGELAYDIVEGVVSITLYPNAGALPSGTYYGAKYELENGAVYEEQWIVPNLPTVNLGQVRVSFPPTPSVLISPTQLTSMNAQPGMFLMWDGARWVPGYPSTFNLDPNWIGVNIGALGDDINVDGSPVSVGNYVTIHIPDAGAAARGVVSTAAQTFAGAKTLKDVATISQSLIFAQHAIYAGTRGELVNVGTVSAHALYFGGDIVAARVATTDRPRVQADRLVTGHIDIDTIADPPTAMMPGNATSPAKGTESILLPHDGVDWAGIGMGQNGSLWLRTGGAFFYLNQNGATCRELRMDPYQHPNSVGIEATRNDATMVIYSDSTSWGGYGVNTTPELWFRMGPDNAGAYYYFGAGGATFPSLAVGTLVVNGAVTLPPDSGLIPTFEIDGAPVGTRPILNFVQGTNVSIQGVEDNTLNRVDIHLSAAGGGESGGLVDPTNAKGDLIVRGAPKPAIPTALGVGGNGLVLTADSTAATGIKWASALPANDTSTQRLRISRAATLIAARQELNLIPGANVTLTVVDNPGSNRVDATVAVGAIGALQTPWTSDIDAANHMLFGVSKIGIGNSMATLPFVDASATHAVVGPGVGYGALTVACNNATAGVLAALVFANYAIGATDKRLAMIAGSVGSTPDSGALIFYTAQAGAITERVRLTAAGNLGIATLSPITRVHVVGGAWTPGTVGVPAGGLVTDGAFGGGIGMIDGTKTISLYSTFGDLNFAIGTTSTGLATRMIMSAAGYLGIGIAPQVTFDVLGTGLFRATVLQNPSGGKGVRVGYESVANVGDILCYDWAGLAFQPLWIRGNPVTFPGGSVGIGVDAPSSALQVVGTVTTNILYLAAGTPPGWDTATRIWFENAFGTRYDGYQHRFDVAGTRTEAMRINTAGNVGIGTTPSYRLDVNGGRCMFAAASERYSVGFRYVAGGPVFWQGTDLNGDMIFSEAGGTERMRIKANSGVRIGINGYTLQNGDLGVSRDAAPNTGAVFFGNGGQVIFYDGGAFSVSSHITTPGQIQAASGYITGRLGVGTGAAVSRAHIYGSGQDGSGGHYWPGLNPDCELYVQDSGGAGGNGGAVVFGSGYGVHAVMKGFVTNGSGPMGDLVWYVRPTTTDSALFEKMRLNSAGLLSVQGNVNIIGQYQVNGVPISTGGIAGMYTQNNGSAPIGPFQYFNFQPSAQITWSNTPGGTGNNTLNILAVYNTSDIRLKTNIRPLEGGLPIIQQLRPIKAEWNGLGYRTAGLPVISVIAQDLAAIEPDAVASFRSKLRPDDEEDIELLSIDSMAITAHLILAVQQLERRLKVLEQRVN